MTVETVGGASGYGTLPAPIALQLARGTAPSSTGLTYRP